LQITKAVGDRICFDGTAGQAHILVSGYDTSPTPIRLGMDGDNKTIQVATHLIRLYEYAMRNSPVRIGVNGTSTVRAGSLTDDQRDNFKNTYVGNWHGGLSATNAVSAMGSLLGFGRAFIPVDVGIGILSSYIEHRNRFNNASSLRNEANMASGLRDLGATISYSNVNGTIVIHGVQLNTAEVLLTTHGFFAYSGSNLSPEQLQTIILNGRDGVGWEPLLPETVNGLDRDGQLAVFAQFDGYRNNYSTNQPFTDELGRVRDNLRGDNATRFNELRERYGIADGTYTTNYPPKMIRFLIELYWGRVEEIQP